MRKTKVYTLKKIKNKEKHSRTRINNITIICDKRRSLQNDGNSCQHNFDCLRLAQKNFVVHLQIFSY